MASVQECEQALQTVARRLAALDPEVRNRHVVERSVSCRVPDLEVVFVARLASAGLVDLRCQDDATKPAAQLRLTASSDDLLALLEGRLAAPAAWATGRLRVEASVRDLLRLRALL